MKQEQKEKDPLKAHDGQQITSLYLQAVRANAEELLGSSEAARLWWGSTTVITMAQFVQNGIQFRIESNIGKILPVCQYMTVDHSGVASFPPEASRWFCPGDVCFPTLAELVDYLNERAEQVELREELDDLNTRIDDIARMREVYTIEAQSGKWRESPEKKVAALLTQRTVISNAEDELRKQRKAVEKEIAEAACPFALGERVNNGKEDYFVDRIDFQGWKPYYELFGKKIKKDGTPYKQAVRIYRWGQNEITKVETERPDQKET